jgi:hypothetical protein
MAKIQLANDPRYPAGTIAEIEVPKGSNEDFIDQAINQYVDARYGPAKPQVNPPQPKQLQTKSDSSSGSIFPKVAGHLGNVASAYWNTVNPLNYLQGPGGFGMQQDMITPQSLPRDMQLPIPHNVDEVIGSSLPFLFGGAAGASPKINSALKGAGQGAIDSSFGPSVYFRGIEVPPVVASAAGGAATGYWSGGHGMGGAMVGAAIPPVVGAVRGAIKGAAGQPWINPALVENMQNAFKKPFVPPPETGISHDFSAPRLPEPPPPITTPPPDLPRLPGPVGMQTVQPPVEFTRTETPPSGLPPVQPPQLPIGQRTFNMPPVIQPELPPGPPQPRLIGPATSYQMPTGEPLPAGPPALPEVKPEVKPPELITESNWHKQERPTVKPPEKKSTTQEEAPIKEGPTPKAPEKKLTTSQLQKFALERKSFTADEVERHFGATEEETKNILKIMSEEDMVHNVSGKWKPGKAPVKVNPPKKKVVVTDEEMDKKAQETPKTEESKKEPEKTLSVEEMMSKVKVDTPEMSAAKKTLARLREKDALTNLEQKQMDALIQKIHGKEIKDEIQGKQTKETQTAESENSITSADKEVGRKETAKGTLALDKIISEVRPEWKPGDQISHDHLYRVAEALGTKATPLARFLIERGFDVQPSKFGSGKYGLERATKEDMTALFEKYSRDKKK